MALKWYPPHPGDEIVRSSVHEVKVKAGDLVRHVYEERIGVVVSDWSWEVIVDLLNKEGESLGERVSWYRNYLEVIKRS